MDYRLTDIEIRVLGCLIEKELSTPDYYPLSLNSLANACSQKSNRDPVSAFDEDTVHEALYSLKQKQLVHQSNVGRVAKYEELFLKACSFVNREASVLAELMLRGPQTPGELRSRTERMHRFEGLEGVNEVLGDLESLGYVVRLPRQPGRKECRYAHLLAGKAPEQEDAEAVTPDTVPVRSHGGDRIADLEETVTSLRHEVEELKQAFADFKKQFD